MQIGLVLGKFYPLHIGHIALIEFSSLQCDELIVLVCASDKENISGEQRLKWVEESFKNDSIIKPILLNYLESELPNTSVSSREVSKIWASKIREILPIIDVIFTSETYGEYLAEYLICKHISFDKDRIGYQISASKINTDTFKYWDYLADSVKPYYTKLVCISGTESTGKSILTKRLANYFHTDFVPEMAREIVEKTYECTKHNLVQIAELHAKTIIEKMKNNNKILFVDTDLNITASYSKFIFGKKLTVENWVKQANQFDLYLYLDNDVPFIQDGTRLEKQRRDKLDISHKNELLENGIKFEIIKGNWEEKFKNAVSLIEEIW